MKKIAIALLSIGLLFGTSTASSYTIEISTTDPTVGITIGDIVTVTVSGDFDPGTILWSASVRFNPFVLQYNQGNSNNLSGIGYALYTPPAGKTPGNWLTAFDGGGCPGYGDPGAGDGCGVWSPAPPQAVWINLISSLGTSAGIDGSGNIEIASLEFQVLDHPNTTTTIELLFDVSVGSVITQEVGSVIAEVTPTSISDPISVRVPEPTIAGLCLLSLVGVAALRRHSLES